MSIEYNMKYSETTGAIHEIVSNFNYRYEKLKEMFIDEWNINDKVYTCKEVNNLLQDIDKQFNTNYKTMLNTLMKNRKYLQGTRLDNKYTFIDIVNDTIILENNENNTEETYKLNKNTNSKLTTLLQNTLEKHYTQDSIVMLQKIHKTRKGNYILTVEDPTSNFKAFLNPKKIGNPELLNQLIEDEVIRIKTCLTDFPVRGSNKAQDRLCITQLNELSFKTQNKHYQNNHLVFLSDLHVGSLKFDQKSLNNLINYINTEKPDAIIISGDIVDGLGVYPGQEYDLGILDIFDQYKYASEQLQRINPDIPIYISPGNHDATRLAEPQPIIPKKYAKSLHDMENVTMLSNPATININGTRILMYHGKAFDDLVKQIETCTYTNPINCMKQQLEKRHITTTYGESTPISPEPEDPLLITKLPHIYHTGHVHIAQTHEYKGITLINSGTYQKQTSFQKTHGLHPNTGHTPIIKNNKVFIKDFRTED